MPPPALVKEAALNGLKERRARALRVVPVDNSRLRAGSDMYFYCKVCGWLADLKPEAYLFPPRTLCSECEALKAEGWLPE